MAAPVPTAHNLKVLEGKMQELRVLSTIARANTKTQFGKQFGGDRDLDASLGWEPEPSWETYFSQYRRGGIAKTLVNIRPEDTWRGDITVSVQANAKGQFPKNKDEFEKKFTEIWERLRLKEKYLRADKLCGVGQYSVLRIGYKEPTEADLTKAVSPAGVADLLYVSVYSQPNAEAATLFNDSNDPRFGEVETYQITTSNQITKSLTGKTTRSIDVKEGQTQVVHADRVVHIAENLLEDEIYGTPRLECVLNNLYDLQKVTGGSAEMYWQGAFPGIAFELDPEAELDPTDLEDMQEQIDDMIMGLKRYMKLQGVKTHQLSPTVVSPEKQVDVQLDQIAGSSRVPKRILIGSERGELASTTDGDNWGKVIQGRRETDCNRWIRDLIGKLMRFGVLPFVPNYVVNWPGLTAEKDKENSETALNTARAIKEFVQGDGESVMPLSMFLSRVLRLDKAEADDIADMIEEGNEDDDKLEEEFNNAVDDAVARQLAELKKAQQTPAANSEDDTTGDLDENDGE